MSVETEPVVVVVDADTKEVAEYLSQRWKDDDEGNAFVMGVMRAWKKHQDEDDSSSSDFFYVATIEDYQQFHLYTDTQRDFNKWLSLDKDWKKYRAWKKHQDEDDFFSPASLHKDNKKLRKQLAEAQKKREEYFTASRAYKHLNSIYLSLMAIDKDKIARLKRRLSRV